MSWYLFHRAWGAIRCAFAGHQWVASTFPGTQRCQRCDARRFA